MKLASERCKLDVHDQKCMYSKGGFAWDHERDAKREVKDENEE